MSKFRFIIVATLLIAWGQSALYTVDQAEFAAVTRFGEPIAVVDGSTDAGLHVKAPWPVDSVQRLERRLQFFDLPPTESLTRDPLNKTIDKTLTVDAYLCWRIPNADAVGRFIRTVGTPEQVKRLLTPRVTSRLAAVISNIPLDELIQVSDEPTRAARMEKLHRQFLSLEEGESLPDVALRENGVELVEVRLRRFNYPEAVRSSIADRIRSERARKVAEYQSEGNRRATEILSGAERDARQIEAEARAAKERIEGKASVEADELRNQAHGQDPEFYAFLQKLKSYQAMLADTRDVLLLSTRHPLFDLLLNPPRPALPSANEKKQP